MRKLLVIAGRPFSTKKSAQEATQQILRGAILGVPLAGDQLAFVLDLLDRHPAVDAKIGCGVQWIVVRENAPYGKPMHGFWIIRKDGTEVDFSYLECLRATPHDRKVKNAMRHAITAQIVSYKQRYFKEAAIRPCEYSAIPMPYTRCHVDHGAPNTFDRLVSMFLEAEGIEFAEVLVDAGMATGQIGDRLVDEQLSARWQRFHEDHADLRCVLAIVNLSKKRQAGACRGRPG